ncbi:hypothetical protein Btru_003203 [Bulinus truncatus]|nr:hypothetical protein Btru_003203 [Bulinus truncatus]
MIDAVVVMVTWMAAKRKKKSPLFESGDLSKDFGLDITVFHGGLVKSAISQQKYQSVCSSIYHRFTLTLAEHINEETKLRRLLKSSKCSRNEVTAGKDKPFPAHTGQYNGHNINGGDGDGVDRGHENDDRGEDVQICSDTNNEGTVSWLNQGKVTPAVKCRTNAERSKVELSPGHAKRKYTEFDGRIEPSSSNLSKNRVIRVNAKTFSRLMKGQICTQLLNATENYILTPFPGESHENNDRERLVVAKQRTTYQTPTLASELKVNNMLAIQRDLMGERSTRRSVRDVLSNARDRRARVFRVQQTSYKFCDDLQFRGVNESEWTRRVVSREEAGGEPTSGKQTAMLKRRQQLLRLRPRCLNSDPSSSSDSRHAPSIATGDVDVDTDVAGLASDDRFPAIPVSKQDPQSSVVERPDIRLASYSNSKTANGTGTPMFDPSNTKSINKTKMDGIKVDNVCPPSQKHPDIPNLSTKENLARDKTYVKTADISLVLLSANQNRIFKSRQESFTGDRRKLTNSAPAPHTAGDPLTTGQCTVSVKPLHTMQDVTRVVKQWKDEDKTREHKLNLWRMRMTFAALGRRDMSRSGPAKFKA